MMLRSVLISVVTIALLIASASAKQGAGRALYTVPNMGFIEQPKGESVVTINDTSGSISSLQATINDARSANPDEVIVIYLLRGATYSVSSDGLVFDSHDVWSLRGPSSRQSTPQLPYR